MVERLDPRGYDVIPISAPNDLEKKYNYLWRFWNCIPKGGHIAVFDRTWYGRVLVERVEGFCLEAVITSYSIHYTKLYESGLFRIISDIAHLALQVNMRAKRESVAEVIYRLGCAS